MASPHENKVEGVHISISPMALHALMGSTGPAASGGESGKEYTPRGGGSGEVWKGDWGMDDPSIKAALQGSSGRGETGGSFLTRGLPPSNTFSPSGSPTTPRKSLLGGR